MHAGVSNNGFLFVPVYHYTQNLPSSGLSCSLYDNGHAKLGFPGGSDGKESTCNSGDLGSIPGSGRYPREGRGNPLQYFCLENTALSLMDRGASWDTVHGVPKSQTQLSD